jgi:hypothetical protein
VTARLLGDGDRYGGSKNISSTFCRSSIGDRISATRCGVRKQIVDGTSLAISSFTFERAWLARAP